VSNIMPLLVMLGLPATAGTSEVIDAIRKLQTSASIQRQRAQAMEEAWKEAHARLTRAEDPDNWRAVWTGDESTSDVETTALNHGNLVELAGVGQVLMHFRPCCQNLRCDCTRRLIKGGYCTCHDNDE